MMFGFFEYLRFFRGRRGLSDALRLPLPGTVKFISLLFNETQFSDLHYPIHRCNYPFEYSAKFEKGTVYRIIYRFFNHSLT